MKVTLLGATGRTGKHVLDILLQKGHSVHALVRDHSKIKINSDKQLFVQEGNTTNLDTLRTAMNGCEVVVSVLNISRNSDFPWSGLRTPKTLISDTIRNAIKIAKDLGTNKIIVCSAWGVSETKEDLPGWFRWFIDNSNIAAAYRDHETQERLLIESGLNYVIIRPAGLTSSKKNEIQVSVNNFPKPNLTIGRKATAEFIVRMLKDDTYLKKAVTISAA